MSIKDEMNQVIHTFLSEVAALARRAVIDTLGAAFGRDDTPRAATPMTPVGRPRSNHVRKRRPSELSALSSKFVRFVRQNPGLRVEQINKQLGTTTKDLALPIRELLAERLIQKRNQKRSTIYFPGTSTESART